MGKLRDETGLTLVEALVAIAILAFAVTGIIQFYLSSVAVSEINQEETMALSHLVNMAEAVKCTPFSNITSDFPDGVADGTGNSYAGIVGGYGLTEECIVVSYDDPDSDPLEIIISASWQDKRGRSRIRHLVTKRTR